MVPPKFMSRVFSENVRQHLSELARVKLVALDFDGVLTNNRVMVDQNGIESVQCDRSDSLGIGVIQEMGVEVVVISKEKNEVVRRRCEKIGIGCFHGIDDKMSLLSQMINKRGLDLSQICFMGNDRNDVECMVAVGISFAPSDAWPEASEIADIVTGRKGGEGAVRELCESIEYAIRNSENNRIN